MFRSFVLFLLILFFSSCEKWDLERISFVQVVTVGAIETSATDAFLIGDIEGLREGEIYERGFVLSTSVNEDSGLRIFEENTFIILVPRQDTITSDLAFAARAFKLTPQTVYYFRAYAFITGESDPIYGGIESFETGGISMDIVSLRREATGCPGYVTVTVEVSGISGFENTVGIVWSDNPDNILPDVGNGNVVLASGALPLGTNQIEYSVPAECGKPYFVRAFVVTSGGEIYSGFYPFTLSIDGEWIQRASFPGIPRVNPVPFSVGNKLLLAGGIDVALEGDGFRDLWEYDPIKNEWTLSGEFRETARRNVTGISINGRGYLIGGTVGNEECGFQPNCICNSASVISYNPENHSIDNISAFPGGRRAMAMTFSLGDQGYICSGIEFTCDNGQFGWQAHRDVWMFDPSSEWKRMDDLPGPARVFGIRFSLTGKAYLGLGIQPPATILSDFYEFDPVANEGSQFREMESFPGDALTPNGGWAGFSLIDAGFLLASPDRISPVQVWKFDPGDGERGSWTRLADFDISSPTAAFSIGRLGFLYEAPSSFWMYVPPLEFGS